MPHAHAPPLERPASTHSVHAFTHRTHHTGRCFQVAPYNASQDAHSSLAVNCQVGCARIPVARLRFTHVLRVRECKGREPAGQRSQGSCEFMNCLAAAMAVKACTRHPKPCVPDSIT